MTERKLIVQPDPDALAFYVANWIVEESTETDGVFSIALSGGSTPKKLYELLATPEFRARLPWPSIHWFWGDERFVPANDPLSNYRMVWEALLAGAPVPEENIHRIPTEDLTPNEAAELYEGTLRLFHGSKRLGGTHPLFDINLLGLGEDGHTASLFPGHDVLNERTRWVAPVIGAKTEARITLTYPALESSRYAAFLVAGAEKHDILARLMANDAALPSAHVKPTGKALVFADKAAVG
jgi:6-phosphogluconolactonase